MKIGDCPKCMEYINTELKYNFILIDAIASVALSTNKTVKELQISWMTGYHKEGHPDNYETGNYDGGFYKDERKLSSDLDRINSDRDNL